MLLGFNVISSFHSDIICACLFTYDQICQGYMLILLVFLKKELMALLIFSTDTCFLMYSFLLFIFPLFLEIDAKTPLYGLSSSSLFFFFFGIHILRLDISFQVLILPSPPGFNVYLFYSDSIVFSNFYDFFEPCII